MVVIVNGLFRTGSTLVFQLVKELLNVKGVCYDLPISEIDKQENYTENYVIKNHGYFPKVQRNYFKIVLTIRNVYDSIFSSMKVWPEKFEKDRESEIRLMVQNYKNFLNEYMLFESENPGQCLLISYEHFYNDNVHLINSLCKFLNLDISGDARAIIANYNSIESIKEKIGEGVDPKQIAYGQFRKGHISDYNGLPGYGKAYMQENLKKIIYDELKNDSSF